MKEDSQSIQNSNEVGEIAGETIKILKQAKKTESVDLVELNRGSFPIHALNPVMRCIAEQTANANQTVVELPAMAAIATLAGAIGKAWVSTGASNNSETPCNLYVIPAVPMSYGKGLTRIIIDPIIEISNEIYAQFLKKERPKLENEKEDINAEIKIITKLLNPFEVNDSPLTESQKEEKRIRRDELRQRLHQIEPLLKYNPTYWAGGSSMAGMTELLARNDETIFHYSPEAGEPVRIMLGKQTKDQNAELDLLLSGYSVEPYGNMTISRGQHQLVPCISLLLMCQPFILRELITNEEAFERGMTARLLFFVIEPENIPEDDGVQRIISDETKEQWYSLIRDILNVRARRKEPKKIVWTKEAREVFRKFHNESVALRNGHYRDIEGQIGRWRENAIRIGNGIVVADALTGHGEPEVGTEEQAMRAVEIARWCGLSSLSLINAGRREKRMEKVRHLQKIVAENKGQITFGALKDRHGFHSREIESLVAEFPSELLITDHKPKNGRPTRILTIPTNRENESKD